MFSRDSDGESVEALKAEIVRLERAVNELTILSDLAFAIGGSKDPDEIVETLVDKLMRAVNAEQAVVTLIDSEDDNAMQTQVRVVSSAADQSPFHMKELLLGWMHLHKKALVSNDPHNDDEAKKLGWDSTIKTVMCVPLQAKGNLIGVLAVYNKRGGGFTNEDERLVTIIAGQSATLIENARLYQQSLLLARMQDEEKHASRIQQMMLPEAPAVEGYDLAGHSVPARTVGGDYFDFIDAGEGRWAICLGDVSGKGLPASLLMANTHATLRGQTLTGDPVATRIYRANDHLCHTTDDEKFVTMFYGDLDTRTHEITFCNAGHEHPYLFGSNGEAKRLETGGLALGFWEGFDYKADALTMEPGDTMVVFSDGVTDATNEVEEQFGGDRLEAVIRENTNLDAAELLHKIIGAVETHAAGAPQFDDDTVVVVKRR